MSSSSTRINLFQIQLPKHNATLLNEILPSINQRKSSRILTSSELKAIGFRVSEHKRHLKLSYQNDREIVYQFHLWGDIAAFLHTQSEKSIARKNSQRKYQVQLAGDNWSDEAIQKAISKIVHARIY